MSTTGLTIEQVRAMNPQLFMAGLLHVWAYSTKKKALAEAKTPEKLDAYLKKCALKTRAELDEIIAYNRGACHMFATAAFLLHTGKLPTTVEQMNEMRALLKEMGADMELRQQPGPKEEPNG